MKNRLCDYLSIPGPDIVDVVPANVEVRLETVNEDTTEEELKAKIKQNKEMHLNLEALLNNKKRAREEYEAF